MECAKETFPRNDFPHPIEFYILLLGKGTWDLRVFFGKKKIIVVASRLLRQGGQTFSECLATYFY